MKQEFVSFMRKVAKTKVLELVEKDDDSLKL